MTDLRPHINLWIVVTLHISNVSPSVINILHATSEINRFETGLSSLHNFCMWYYQ